MPLANEQHFGILKIAPGDAKSLISVEVGGEENIAADTQAVAFGLIGSAENM